MPYVPNIKILRGLRSGSVHFLGTCVMKLETAAQYQILIFPAVKHVFFLEVTNRGETILEWISSPPLVSAMLITTKGDESPGSSRMGVIGALVIVSI